MAQVAQTAQVMFVCGAPSCEGARPRAAESCGRTDAMPCPGRKCATDDSERPMCEVLPVLCQRLGADLKVVYSAADAFLAIRDERPNLVLTDAILPDMTGFELCREVKTRFGRVPVLIFSPGGTSFDGEQRAARVRAEAYLPYPIEPQVLVSSIQSIVPARAPKAVGMPGAFAFEAE